MRRWRARCGTRWRPSAPFRDPILVPVMPVGRYTVMDGEGNRVGTEEFRCAPGLAGGRSTSAGRVRGATEEAFVG